METQTSAIRDRSKGRTVTDICYIAVFAALIAILAQITIPMPGGVPMTLQTLAVALAGVVLGPKRGTLASAVYVLLGVVGLPVFAGLTGGPGKVLGLTGGFLIAFPLLAFLAGLGAWAARNAADRLLLRFLLLWGGLIAGVAADYAVGVLWFMMISGTGLAAAVTACVLPFVLTEVVKICLTGILGPILRGALTRAGLLQ